MTRLYFLVVVTVKFPLMQLSMNHQIRHLSQLTWSSWISFRSVFISAGRYTLESLEWAVCQSTSVLTLYTQKRHGHWTQMSRGSACKFHLPLVDKVLLSKVAHIFRIAQGSPVKVYYSLLVCTYTSSSWCLFFLKTFFQEQYIPKFSQNESKTSYTSHFSVNLNPSQPRKHLKSCVPVFHNFLPSIHN